MMPDNLLPPNRAVATDPPGGGKDKTSLLSSLDHVVTLIENYAAERDNTLTLTPETSGRIASFSTILRTLAQTGPSLSAQALPFLSAALQNLEVAIQRVISLPNDTAIGSVLMAYESALAPFVLLSDVESQIRYAVAAARADIERSARRLSADINAEVVQSIRTANDERRRLETETQRLTKNLVEELRASGESINAAIRTDISEQVLSNAQNEFASAETRASRDVKFWAVIAFAILGGLIGFGWYLVKNQETLFVVHPSWTWQFVYIGGLRVALLAAFAALGSFSLRMLKQHINIRHAVAHKCRILKSVPGLLVSSPIDDRYTTLQVIISALLSDKELAMPDDNPESLTIATPKIPRGGKLRERDTEN